MKIKRSHIITALVLVAFGVVWVRGFWFGEVFHSHKRNEPNRKALLEIRERIGIGASQAEVLSAYWQHRTDVLRLFADRPTDWIITMPLEFGASDWNMRIEFKDGRVTAVRVRTSDGPQPKDGPKDKEKEGAYQSRSTDFQLAAVRHGQASGMQYLLLPITNRRMPVDVALKIGQPFITVDSVAAYLGEVPGEVVVILAEPWDFVGDRRVLQRMGNSDFKRLKRQVRQMHSNVQILDSEFSLFESLGLDRLGI